MEVRTSLKASPRGYCRGSVNKLHETCPWPLRSPTTAICKAGPRRATGVGTVVGVGDSLGLGVGSARMTGEYRRHTVSTVTETRPTNEYRTEARTTDRMLLPIPEKKEGPAGPSRKLPENLPRSYISTDCRR